MMLMLVFHHIVRQNILSFFKGGIKNVKEFGTDDESIIFNLHDCYSFKFKDTYCANFRTVFMF